MAHRFVLQFYVLIAGVSASNRIMASSTKTGTGGPECILRPFSGSLCPLVFNEDLGTFRYKNPSATAQKFEIECGLRRCLLDFWLPRRVPARVTGIMARYSHSNETTETGVTG
jgi:hypothetical protein